MKILSLMKEMVSIWPMICVKHVSSTIDWWRMCESRWIILRKFKHIGDARRHKYLYWKLENMLVIVNIAVTKRQVSLKFDLHATKYQTILIGLLVLGQVVIIENTNFEYGVIAASAKVSNSQHRKHLKH